MRSGLTLQIAASTRSSQPARGGSSIITSGETPLSKSAGSSTAASPKMNSALEQPLATAFFLASSIAGATISIP